MPSVGLALHFILGTAIATGQALTETGLGAVVTPTARRVITALRTGSATLNGVTHTENQNHQKLMQKPSDTYLKKPHCDFPPEIAARHLANPVVHSRHWPYGKLDVYAFLSTHRCSFWHQIHSSVVQLAHVVSAEQAVGQGNVSSLVRLPITRHLPIS